MYEAFKPKAGRVYAYSQNHTFIPMAGLGVAAYAVYGEVPEAAEWAKLVRAIYQRVLETYSHDGYYYEGYEYWIFATPWLVHYLDAQKHVTGEDLFDRPGLRQMYLYAAHGLLPGGQLHCDFGDAYDGPITRAKKGDDWERSHPGGKFLTNYNVLYDLAREFQDPHSQGVADWMGKTLGQVNAEEWWTLVWRDAQVKAAPMSSLPPYHRFADVDMVFWRSGWGADATAVAFKCGPPEGHATAELVKQYPDWRLEDGHVHPDAASFILYAKGHYLTGDSGYAGVPRTVEHNSLLVNGTGQGKEGSHDAWGGIPYSQLNDIRLGSVEMDAKGFRATGEAAAAYGKGLGLVEFRRTIRYGGGNELAVDDSLRASRPVRFTEVLHADDSIEALAGNAFVLHSDGGTLKAQVVAEPAAAAQVEANVVMGPGRPGSVDKGSLERRGERLLLTTPETATATYRWKLEF